MDLQISAFDFRTARELHRLSDPLTAFRTYAVIGGVGAYAREMVDGDLPARPGDFDRWVCRRVLSPSAPLFNEIELLLSEDPSTSKARKINLYHAVLAGIGTGHHAHARLSAYVKVSGASLAPIVEALVSAGLIERVQDPIRDNRPTYHPADPLIRFHYGVIRRHRARLARHDAHTREIWRNLLPTFHAQVVGPCFESVARYWAAHLATPKTLGGEPEHVGPTTVSLPGGADRQLDVIVARADSEVASERTILAIGEAKAGERISQRHLRRLEETKVALGKRAADAKLLLFGTQFTPAVVTTAARRASVELIDLERLYTAG
jgi:hypothetical protein